MQKRDMGLSLGVLVSNSRIHNGNAVASLGVYRLDSMSGCPCFPCFPCFGGSFQRFPPLPLTTLNAHTVHIHGQARPLASFVYNFILKLIYLEIKFNHLGNKDSSHAHLGVHDKVC